MKKYNKKLNVGNRLIEGSRMSDMRIKRAIQPTILNVKRRRR